ncbi:hypothetical protein AGMMS50268_40570 [Spirochaetia bacterium]|nr:hypothetical protein AGMMS50268_40570 [Spirochaetia bacterium]
MDFKAGTHVLFITDLSDEIIYEGWLLQPMFFQDPGQFWSVTTDIHVKERILNNTEEPIDERVFTEIGTIQTVRTKFMFEHSEKNRKKWGKFINYLKTDFINKNLNYRNEVLLYIGGKNSKKRIFFKALLKFVSKPVNFLLNVVFLGLLQFVFGGFIDYFKNEYQIWKLYGKKKKLEKFSYLKEYIQHLANVEPGDDELEKIENELKELKDKRFEIYGVIIAILISVASLIVSIIKE